MYARREETKRKLYPRTHIDGIKQSCKVCGLESKCSPFRQKEMGGGEHCEVGFVLKKELRES